MSAIICLCPSFLQKVPYIRSYQNVPSDVHSIYRMHTYKVNSTPQQATNVLRRSSGIALLFLQPRHWTWLFYTRERDSVPIVQEAEWVWTGAENLASTGIRTRTDGFHRVKQEVGEHSA